MYKQLIGFIGVIYILTLMSSEQPSFNLKLIERSQKEDIPWSLTGSAADLRSDVKHEIQNIMNSLTLLWPEAIWDSGENVMPQVSTLQGSFDWLSDYIKHEKRKDKVAMVVESITYILNTYAPQVQKKINTSAAHMVDMDKKRELFAVLVDHIKQELQKMQSQGA